MEKQWASFFGPYPGVVFAGPKGTRYRGHLGELEITVLLPFSFFLWLRAAPVQPLVATRLDKEQVAREGPLGTVETLPRPPLSWLPLE